MQEMVYEDARWVQRLRKMGCWDEREAQKSTSITYGLESELSPARARRKSTISDARSGSGKRSSLSPQGHLAQSRSSHIMKSASTHTNPYTNKVHASLSSDGFDSVPVNASPEMQPHPASDHDQELSVLDRVRSIRGQAREEFGKVYKVLSPYYNDAVDASKAMHCAVFRSYTSPDQQAQMLAQLQRFSLSDSGGGAETRISRLSEVVSIFDTAALLEFRKGYEDGDIHGRMRHYAQVLYTLNEGRTSIDLFVNHNQLITEKDRLGSAGDCIDYSFGRGQVSLEQIQRYFDKLQMKYTAQHAIIEDAFPVPDLVLTDFVKSVGEKILAPYLSSLFDEVHSRGQLSYVKVVSSSYLQVRSLFLDIRPAHELSEAYQTAVNKVINGIFEPHLDLYLNEELDSFTKLAEAEIEAWDRALSEEANSTEKFLMSNVNRQADKKAFLSTFKKVVMMPVTILPGLPTLSANKSTAKALVEGQGRDISRSSTPVSGDDRTSANPLRAGTPLPLEAPTTELAAKAAIMTSKLENIRSLFSLEVALNLVHMAKASLERVAQFNSRPGPASRAARSQCSAIYVSLLHILGTLHVKAGFDNAVDHLGTYKPHQGRDRDEKDKAAAGNGVPPLTTFLELVNVGDLIQQMLDVFFESELIRLNIANRDDFLDPAVKEKKRFEQMLDERVAAGLGKGIDVLMDEVDHIFATTQSPLDFNPPLASSSSILGPGVASSAAPASPSSMSRSTSSLALSPATVHAPPTGPTQTSTNIISLLNTHTDQLTGTTEKSLLDVFRTEIGVRLFASLTKHLKRHRISTAGALPLLSDLAVYSNHVASFRNPDLTACFVALREVAQIYLVEVVVKPPAENSGRKESAASIRNNISSNPGTGGSAVLDQAAINSLAAIIADSDRYRGIFTVEEVMEFVERRADWMLFRGAVEEKVFGQGCVLM